MQVSLYLKELWLEILHTAQICMLNVNFLGYFTRNLHLDRSILQSLNPKISYVSWSLFSILISLCGMQVGKKKEGGFYLTVLDIENPAQIPVY